MQQARTVHACVRAGAPSSRALLTSVNAQLVKVLMLLQ